MRVPAAVAVSVPGRWCRALGDDLGTGRAHGEHVSECDVSCRYANLAKPPEPEIDL
jgi:hypothetical protein